MNSIKAILFVFVSIIAFHTYGQIIPIVHNVELSINEDLKIKKYLETYKSVSFNKSQIIESLEQNRSCSFAIEIDEIDSWEISLEYNDLRSDGFKATYVSDSGEYEFMQYELNTYKGTTQNGDIVRFTIDEDNFYGVILIENQIKVLKQANKIDTSLPDDVILVFDSDDIIAKMDDFPVDFIDAIEVNETIGVESPGLLKATICAYYCEIGTDADFEYYQDNGSDLVDTYGAVFAVLNILDGVYESTFGLRFVVVLQNVWTTSSDPYTSTDAFNLLVEFRDEWNTNRSGVRREIAHLFTGKNLNAWGIAYLGQINTNYAYGVSANRIEMFETTAHEIGHNFDAIDNPTDGDCGTADASVMCQGIKDNNLWFSSNSISEIAPFLSTNALPLYNPISTELTLSGTVTGFNEYQAREKITSTQTIQSGFTVYKSDEIVLNGEFKACIGCVFEMRNDDTGCN